MAKPTPEKVREYNARYKAKHPERYAETRRKDNARPETAARRKLWKERNQEAVRAAARSRRVARYQRDKVTGRAEAKAWREANPEKVKDIRSRHYAKNRASVIAKSIDKIARRKAVISLGSVGLSEWREICEMHAGRCVYCGTTPKKLTMDHVVPLSRGGHHSPLNIVPACKSCNSSKGAKLLHEWLREQYQLGRISA